MIPHDGFNIVSVDAYRPAYTDVEKALDYPGGRPESNYITTGQEVVMLPEGYNAFVIAANAQLSKASLPTIAERIPVLAYGANGNPARLRDKLQKYSTEENAARMHAVPHCMATLPDTLAVWHGQPGQTGSIFAELYRGPEATGTNLRAHVAFLTREQLAAVHASEGVTYSAAELPVKIGNEDSFIDTTVLSYVALKSQVLLHEDKPILVDGLTHEGSSLSTMKAGEAIEYILRHVARDAEVPADVREYVAEGLSFELAERKERQARVGRVLHEIGLNRPYVFAKDAPENLIGRADFTSIPGSHDKHVYQIPEIILPTDLARAVSKRAHAELEKRLS